MDPLLKLVENRSTPTLLVVLLVTVFFGLQIPRLRFETDYLALLPDEKAAPPTPAGRAGRDEEQRPAYRFTSSYFFVVESDDLFAPPLLTALEEAMRKLEARDEFGTGLSPFRLPTWEMRRGVPTIVQMSPKRDDEPWTEEEAAVFKRRLLGDDVAGSYLVSADGRAVLVYYPVEPIAAETRRLAEYREILTPVMEHAAVYINGTAPIAERILYYLQRDLFSLLGLCFACMLLVYYLAFRAKRAMLLPFALSVIGLVWTLGSMALLSFPLTIVNVITPPVVLTLGSSYCIHLLSEYYRSRFDADGGNVTKAVSRIAGTIFVACATTAIGFLSLLVAQTPAFRQFGISVSMGVVYCALLSVTFLPAVLSKLPAPVRRRPTGVSRLLGRATRRLMASSLGKWPLFILLFAVLIAAFFFTRDRVGIESNYMAYFPSNDPLMQDSIRIARTMGGLDPFRVTITAPQNDPDYFASPEVLGRLWEYEQAIQRQCEDIVHVLSYPAYIGFVNRVYSGNPGIPESPAVLRAVSRFVRILRQGEYAGPIRQVISEDGSELTLVIRYYDAELQEFQTGAAAARVMAVLENNIALLPEGASYRIWGTGVQTLMLDEVIKSDQRKSTMLTFFLVAAVSLVFFRSLRFGLYSVVPILAGVMGNYVFMFVAGIPIDLVTLGFAGITIGVGIDDAVHFLQRYRFITNRGASPQNPPGTAGSSVETRLRLTLSEAGRPITLTSLALVAGLMMLVPAAYIPIRYFGILISIALTNTLLATLFVLPAVIIVFEKAETVIRSRSRARPA